MAKLKREVFTVSSVRKVPSWAWGSRHRDYWSDSARAAHRSRARMGVVAVSSVAVCLDVDGRAIFDLEGLGYSRYPRMANADNWCLS
jgi:hypothetical protein